MKSDWLNEQMLAAIDGTLSGTEQRRFDQALADDPAAQARFEALCALTERMRELPTRDEPLDFTDGVMARVSDIRRPWWVRLWIYLTRAHEVRVNLLGALAAAAAVVASVAVGVQLLRQEGTMPAPITAEVQKEYLMRFSYNDPQATQVYVAGSFNDWRKQQIQLTDSAGKGVWIGVLPLKPGIYEYMFYVDGHWVMDEHAQRYKDDGFGRKNAILELGTGDDLSI
ncbi:MAG: hypothetical protein P8045_15420 [Candidatus Thiodiazotropha sp.]